MFCDINFKRSDTEISVLNKQGSPSALYKQLVDFVSKNDVYSGREWFFDKLVEQDKLTNTDPVELALGLYSIAWHSNKSESYWMDKIPQLLPVVQDKPQSVRRTVSEQLYTYSDLQEIFTKEEYYNEVSKMLHEMNPSIKFVFSNDVLGSAYNRLVVEDVDIDSLREFSELTSEVTSPGGASINQIDTIFIDRRASIDTVVHEMVHQTIQKEYESNPVIRNEVNRLYDIAEKWYLDKGYRSEEMPYGMVNPKEFLAESLADSDFMVDLNSIMVDNVSVLTKLVQMISDFINKAFSISVNPNSVLAEVGNLVDQIITNNKSETQIEDLMGIADNFNNYFPDYSWMNGDLKLDVAEITNRGQLTLSCTI